MIVGQKNDGNKPRTDLYPPRALLEVARVLEFGARKYTDNNWRAVDDATRRYTGAALRHILAFMSGQRIDPESGLHELAHACTALMFVIDLDGDCDDFTSYHKSEPRAPKPMGTVKLSADVLDRMAQTALEVGPGGRVGTIMTDNGSVEILT